MGSMTLFETERLLLRPTDESDASLLFYLMNSEKWLKYIGNRDITSFEKARNYILQRIKPQQQRLGFGSFTIIRKEDNKKIGVCGLYQRQGLPGIDIGFAVLPRFEGKGYAFEATEKTLDAGFSLFGLDAIFAITTLQNTASQGLLKKLGLKDSGTIHLPDETEVLLLFKTLKHEIHKAASIEL